MSPARILGIVLLVVGVVLLAYGFSAQDSPADQLSEALTGTPTDQTMWYLIGGAAAAVAGLLLTLFGARR
jgi:drug/metabolite transporter (DMT)-like permease